MITWRIASSRFPAGSFSGNAGRWNHKGSSVIYSASSLALCALEIFANRGELPDDYVAVSINIPDGITVTSLAVAHLPAKWFVNPHLMATRDIGTKWLQSFESPVLSVPSAVVRQERNFILNAAHPDFTRIRFGDPEQFLWDDRLNCVRTDSVFLR